MPTDRDTPGRPPWDQAAPAPNAATEHGARTKAVSVEAPPQTSRKPWSWIPRGVGRGLLALLVLIGGAVGGLFSDWVRSVAEGPFYAVVERGDPIMVETVLRERTGDMWLPAPASLTTENAEELGFTEPVGQFVELQTRGAVMFGDRQVELQLEGNREDGVRITDLRPEAECSNFGSGTLMQMVPHGGGAPSTHRMVVDVQNKSQPPLYYDASIPGVVPDQNFFDVKTLTLSKNEKEFILLDLHTDSQYCTFNLKLTFWEGDEKRTQLVFDKGEELTIAPDTYFEVQDDLKITSSYVGGSLCEKFLPVPPDNYGQLANGGCPPRELG